MSIKSFMDWIVIWYFVCLNFFAQQKLKSVSLTERVCKTAKSKIYFLYFIGVYNSEINPVVPSKILKRVVLPFAFYSYEIWPSLTIYDIQMLEYTQRFSSRIFQGLGFSKFSSSLSSISIIGLWTIQVHIDKYQLYF